jgi:ATP-binding cassette subfamily B multidrug efflux pump
MKNISSLKRVLSYLKPYKVGFTFVILFTLGTVIFNGLLPYVSGLPTTEVAKNLAEGQPLNFEYIKKTLVWIFIVGLGYGVSQLFAGILITNVVQSAMKDLRHDIEAKINRLPVSYFDKNKQGNVLSRVTNDVDAVGGAMQQAMIGIFNAVLSIVIAVGMMFYINSTMALLAVIMIPASLIISKIIVSKSQSYFNNMQNALG